MGWSESGRLRAAAVLLGVAAAAAAAAPANAARRPPAPTGVPVVSAGQLPHPCAAGDERYGADGYSSVMGAYFDAKLNTWASAPYCYPVWGNLAASGSQIVNPGQAATIVATPNGGSNSGTYAPQTKSITWSIGGTRQAGCGSADLTCTVVAAKRATGSWQWFEVKVSMPRTFFVDSPGSNCAGQHLCAGVTTNAWAFIGVRPEKRCVAGARAAAGRVLIGACPTLEKTQEMKDAALEEKRLWEDRYLVWGGMGATSGVVAAGSAVTPGGQGLAGVAGLAAAANGLLAWWASYEATYWGRVAEDPPDRNWRRIARPAATHPKRIALPRTLSKRNRTAVQALLANLLRSGALARCITQSIDRGATALPKNVRIAARQYAAGAKCAREEARRTAAIPRLAASVVKLLQPYDARILAAAATAPRGPAFRRLVTRNIAALAKATGMTAGARKALIKRILTAPATPPAVTPSAALALAGSLAAKQAAETRRVARALAAAAAG